MINENIKEKYDVLLKTLDYTLWYMGKIDELVEINKLSLNSWPDKEVKQFQEKINVYLNRQGDIYGKSKKLRKDINGFIDVFNQKIDVFNRKDINGFINVFNTKIEKSPDLFNLKLLLQACIELLKDIIDLQEKNMQIVHLNNVSLHKSKKLREDINEFMDTFNPKVEQSQLKEHLQECTKLLNDIIDLQEKNMHTALSNNVSLYKKDKRINGIGEKIYNMNSFLDDLSPSKVSKHNFKIEDEKEEIKSVKKEEQVYNLSSLGEHYIGSDNNIITNIEEYIKGDEKPSSLDKGEFMSKSNSKIEDKKKEEIKEIKEIKLENNSISSKETNKIIKIETSRQEDEEEEKRNKSKKNNHKSLVDPTTTKSKTSTKQNLHVQDDIPLGNIITRKTPRYENLQHQNGDGVFVHRRQQNNNDSVNCDCCSKCCNIF